MHPTLAVSTSPLLRILRWISLLPAMRPLQSSTNPLQACSILVTNWQAFSINALSLPVIAAHWNLKPADMSINHKCPVCEMFKDTTPNGPIIYLFHGMNSDAVSQVFSKKPHRGPTCPFVTLLKHEIGEDIVTLRSFLSYSKASVESLRKAAGCKALLQWLVEHPAESLNQRSRLTGIFADKGVIRDTNGSRVNVDSIRHFLGRRKSSRTAICPSFVQPAPPAASSPPRGAAISALAAVLKKRKEACYTASLL